MNKVVIDSTAMKTTIFYANSDIHTYLYIKAILEGKEVMDIEACPRESKILRVRLAAQVIDEGQELKKVGLKLDTDDLEYLLYFGG